MHNVFCQGEIVNSEDAGQCGDHPPRFMPEEMFTEFHYMFSFMTSCTCAPADLGCAETHECLKDASGLTLPAATEHFLSPRFNFVCGQVLQVSCDFPHEAKRVLRFAVTVSPELISQGC